MDDATPLLELALELATQASALLLDGLHRVRADVSTKSSRTDMVTEMDRASEALIVDGLNRARPDDAVMGEEGAAVTGRSGVRWLVDPIDGTTNYLYGHPGFSVSIAAEVDGATAVAVVADPLRHETFSAVRGRGARLGDQHLRVADHTDLATALVGTGFSYLAERRARQAAVLTHVLPAVRDIRRMGSAALDLCWVACRRLDAFYEKGLQPWDLAAGALIAEEAGAWVGGLDGAPASGDFVLACAPQLAPDLERLLREAGAGGA